MNRIKTIALNLLVIFSTLCGGSMAMTTPAYAADCAVSGRSFFEVIPRWYKYLEVDCSTGEVTSFEVPGDIWKIGIAVVEILLRVAGMVAFVFVFWAGFKFVLSRGNPGEAAKARQAVLDAIIGVAITTIATVLVGFLGRALTA